MKKRGKKGEITVNVNVWNALENCECDYSNYRKLEHMMPKQNRMHSLTYTLYDIPYEYHVCIP